MSNQIRTLTFSNTLRTPLERKAALEQSLRSQFKAKGWDDEKIESVINAMLSCVTFENAYEI